MFELEEVIQNWRNGLLQNQSVLESDVDELENHLRDEVDSLMLAGLSAEEASMVSIHRIGDNNSIAQEFAKVNPSSAWSRRVFWMFFGVLVSMVISGIARICSQGSAALLTWLNVDAYGAGVVSILVHMSVFLVFFFTVIFGVGLFAKSIKSKLTMSMALIFCLIAICMLKAGSFAISFLQINLLGAEAFGQLSLASRYAIWAWNILWPVIIVVMLFILWSSRPQKVR